MVIILLVIWAILVVRVVVRVVYLYDPLNSTVLFLVVDTFRESLWAHAPTQFFSSME